MTYGKVLHTEQHGERIVNVRRSLIYPEYRCRLYVYGKAQPDADYFTNDLDDAKSTAKAMATCSHLRRPAYAVEHVPADDTEGGAL
jgi:hypothetical protein